MSLCYAHYELRFIRDPERDPYSYQVEHESPSLGNVHRYIRAQGIDMALPYYSLVEVRTIEREIKWDFYKGHPMQTERGLA